MTTDSIVLQGGNIWTGNGNPRFTGSILLSGNSIVAVNKDEEVLNHPLAIKAKKINVKGKTVLPGFTDSHIHLRTYARQSYGVDLGQCESKGEVLSKIKENSQGKNPTDWIYGYNLNETNWQEQQIPTREDIDSLGISNPVLLIRICLHLYVANSKAIELAGGEFNPSFQNAVRDENGNLNGIFPESSGLAIVDSFENSLSENSDFIDILENVYKELLSYGISEIHTIGASSLGLNEDFALYSELKQAGKLPLRTVVYLDEFPSEEISKYSGDDWLKYGGLKIFLDGSLGPRTAALSYPYSDSNTTGVLLHTEKELQNIFLKAERNNLQVQSHVIGDAAIEQLLNVLEYIEKNRKSRRSYPHKISHIQICRPDQINRVSRLNVVCDVQPNSIATDARMSISRLGEERLNWAFPLRSLIEKGVTLLGSSDCPVEPFNPFLALRAATLRKDLNGFPKDGWNNSESLTIEEALHLYTSNPPKAVGKEKKKGILNPGYLADVVVLDRDIFDIEAESYPDIQVNINIIDGKIVFES